MKLGINQSFSDIANCKAERRRKKSNEQTDGNPPKQSHACLMPAMADTNGSGDKSKLKAFLL